MDHARAPPALAIGGLIKTFERRAVDGLDLTVRAGEFYALLGPNGAGKTTTIRILLGLARKTGGEVAVLGGDPWTDAVALHRRIASVPGDVSVWPNLSGGEAIDFLARLRGAGVKDAAFRAEKERLMAEFQFDPRTKGRAYSKGNRQKVALIAALAVPAELYVLDEPTSGLDPLMEVVFRREVARLHAAGATILLSSHILSEVELLCDRVSIIRAGRIVESGTLADLRHLTRTEISYDANGAGTDAALPGAHDVSAEEGRVRFTVDSDAVTGMLPELAARGVTGLRVAPPSLEEMFLRHYGDAPSTGSGTPAGSGTSASSGVLAGSAVPAGTTRRSRREAR